MVENFQIISRNAVCSLLIFRINYGLCVFFSVYEKSLLILFRFELDKVLYYTLNCAVKKIDRNSIRPASG